ncbi:hypothetical protein XI03_19955 [Bradyrhizobium sp. CCBAU 65884]|uniref:phospholipase D family protein n=1 Tax=Bradyrhizobium sp. CCBAU 65884 TaxID=722477 RepID=UPI0023064F2A|nr:phospholipase D family protein [Bradyrhizobium sp. CCBAU 65884]MDA9476745.1 hypothetical protein [Bradyrhizobium sp. CCBAU 65884]
MQSKTSLDPDCRTLYGASLQPPADYSLDAAIATTFSLDFETALAVPVSLALSAAESRDKILDHPLALLEGAERMAGRLLVFADHGHIQVQTRPHSRLCSLLEKIIVEVAAPKGGAFHPKMWALRFKSTNADKPLCFRLLVMSRNLTRDRSWDVALTLDGLVAKKPQATNRPLADFIRRLPGLAVAHLPPGATELVAGFVEDIRRVEWVLPEPFERVSFAANGFGGTPWRPDPGARLGIVSPFCDEDALSMLAERAAMEAPLLIGRSDELGRLSRDVLNRFSRVAVMDEVATAEDGEEPDSGSLQGLHAKIFVVERGWDTEVTVGSGNATRPALITGRNVELFATLNGRRSQVGSIEDIFGDKGFGRLTRLFVPEEWRNEDEAQRDAEARLDQARREICSGGLKLMCRRFGLDDEAAGLWEMTVQPAKPLPLAGVGALRVWPITRGETHEKNALENLKRGEFVDLGAMPLIDLTRFLACHVVDRETGASLLFATGLTLEGLPIGRNAAILRSIIHNQDAFFRYLRLLLAEFGDPFAAALAAQKDASHGGWRSSEDDKPLLEEMVRAFCRREDRLEAIERLVERLEETDSGSGSPIPPDFHALWQTFRVALRTKSQVQVVES